MLVIDNSQNIQLDNSIWKNVSNYIQLLNSLVLYDVFLF